MLAARHIGATTRELEPECSYAVVVLCGARGAALWRWWLDDARRGGGSAAPKLEAPAPSPPSASFDPAFTVARLPAFGEDEPCRASAGALDH
jgi:hypothetical protein